MRNGIQLLSSAQFSRHTLRARWICLPHATASPIAISLKLSRSSSTIPSSKLPESIVQEQDIVLLKRVFGKDNQTLTKPLKNGRKIQTHFGSLDESQIIGKTYLETVASSAGHAVRIHAPTLAEYVTLTPRHVTPVYPDDANLIVSLLDIHVAPPPAEGAAETARAQLDILEAGTGHGSLTLYLARAIHAANPPHPLQGTGGSDKNAEMIDEQSQSAWKASRTAVVHTVDVSSPYSLAAQKTVAGFRRGLYAGNVDFHVGDVTEFIHRRTQGGTAAQQAFSHILLDLPNVQSHLAASATALRDGGLLLVFCPSVTQIAQCVVAVREQGLPLSYSQVLELGSGLSGGRLWDVRAAKVRNPIKDISVPQRGNTASRNSFFGWIRSLIARLSGTKTADTKQHDRWEMVCRPSVGHRVVGGGFVGVWRRKRMSGEDEETSSATDESKLETSL